MPTEGLHANSEPLQRYWVNRGVVSSTRGKRKQAEGIQGERQLKELIWAGLKGSGRDTPPRVGEKEGHCRKQGKISRNKELGTKHPGLSRKSWK